MVLKDIAKQVSGSVIYLDVDGTLVTDGHTSISPEVQRDVLLLSEKNRVILASNGNDTRTKALAGRLGVEHVSGCHKPFPNKLQRATAKDNNIIVIGDKYITDGLLAVFLKGAFYRSSRLTSSKDSLVTQVVNQIDDLVYMIVPFVHILRPQQWVKNLLLFAPAVFAGTFFFQDTFINGLITFIAFSLAASAVYVGNDIVDRDLDGLHPRKKRRPVASGRLTVVVAGVYGALLALAALLLSVVVPGILLIIALYIVLNSAYSLYLKHIPIMDVSTVSGLYVLRIVAGGIATTTILSSWILIATFLLALFLISAKRKGESTQENKRRVLERYSTQTLDALLLGSALLALTAYSLWTIFTYAHPLTALSIFIVTAVLFRTIHNLYNHPEKGESPELMVFTDPWTLGLTVLWGVSMWFLLYV